MLRELRRRSARGVVIHKIDRSARNLRDWADLGELIDKGIEVHFVIHIRAANQTFEGKHEALISKSMYDRIQGILHGRIGTRVQVFDFPFRRFVKCVHCGNSLIGEMQKGHAYYRCHTKTCPPTSIREEIIGDAVLLALLQLQFSPAEMEYFQSWIAELKGNWAENKEREIQTLKARVEQVSGRLQRTMDAYLDGDIDKELFEDRKAALIQEKRDLSDRARDFAANRASIPEELSKFVELAGSACSLYQTASDEKRRRLLRILMSNCTADRKNIDVCWRIPFRYVAEREKETDGAPAKN